MPTTDTNESSSLLERSQYCMWWLVLLLCRIRVTGPSSADRRDSRVARSVGFAPVQGTPPCRRQEKGQKVDKLFSFCL